MNGVAASIQQFLKSLNDSAGQFLAALTALSVVSMALIQTAKDLLPIRRSFQRSRMRDWLAAGARDANRGQPGPAVPGSAEADLITLAVDGDECAFYDLEIAQMCGQINAALQVVIDYPTRHENLLRIVASEADAADVDTLIATARSPFAEGVAAIPTSDAAGAVAYADARSRVTHQMQRAIDGFQIATAFRWKLWMQLASFMLSAALAAIAVSNSSMKLAFGARALTVVVIAVLAGFLAPVSRDLMVALQGLRN